MQGPGRGLQALKQLRAFPSPELEATVAARLESAEDLLQSLEAGSVPAGRLSGVLMPTLRALASTLQRVENEALQHHALVASAGSSAGGTPASCAAPLYHSLLGSITRLADKPVCCAALDAEQVSSRERVTTVFYCIEILIHQMMSAGIRAMAEEDVDELLEAPRCGLWAATKSLLRAAPNAGLLAVLAFASPRSSCLMGSTRLTKDDPAMKAECIKLVVPALEFVASQAPLFVDSLDPERLAGPLNARLAELMAEGTTAEGQQMKAPIKRGLEALATELVRLGGPQLYGVWRSCMPPYEASQRPPLLEAMQAQWRRIKEQRAQEAPEDRLHRILVKCGFLDTERAGLVELHDFWVEHGAFVSAFCAQSGGESTPYGRMLTGFLRAALRIRETAAAHAADPSVQSADAAEAADAAGAADGGASAVPEPGSPPAVAPLAPVSSNLRQPGAPRSLLSSMTAAAKADGVTSRQAYGRREGQAAPATAAGAALGAPVAQGSSLGGAGARHVRQAADPRAPAGSRLRLPSNLQG